MGSMTLLSEDKQMRWDDFRRSCRSARHVAEQTQGYVVPEAFTHGTSEQCRRWFTTGLESGSPARFNTFDTAQP
jgi:predicted metalloprotease